MKKVKKQSKIKERGPERMQHRRFPSTRIQGLQKNRQSLISSENYFIYITACALGESVGALMSVRDSSVELVLLPWVPERELKQDL